MERDLRVPLFDLIECISNAVDLVSREVSNHHQQVGYIAFRLGAEVGVSEKQQRELVLAGMLHDIGAFSLNDRLETLQFEAEDPRGHSELGYLLLKAFEPLSGAAGLVRYHHVPWHDGRGAQRESGPVPPASHLLHLADRVAVLIDREREILGQVPGIREKIRAQSGRMFVPELVNAFDKLAAKEYFWLDAVMPSVTPLLRERGNAEFVELDMNGLLGLAKLFSQIIDFRSRFTATHSSGVAASAEKLARLMRFSDRECRMMRIAGYLHDLGKLAVPSTILEKPAKLSEDEYNLMKSHTFHTYRTLEPIDGLQVVNAWASLHHERLDGKGYPFHVSGPDLMLGSRIMAVADVFTALREDRPYRPGMTKEKALGVLHQMAEDWALDGSIVALLAGHFDEVDAVRLDAGASEYVRYERLQSRTAM